MRKLTSNPDFVYNKTHLSLLAEQCIEERYHLITSPLLTYAVLIVYLGAVFFGPTVMAKRKPFNILRIIKVYNSVQLIYNSSLVYLYFKMMGMSQGLKIWENSCYPVSAAHNFSTSFVCDQAFFYFVLYLVNKILDLTETILFILRKKNSQISFLHVVHHAVMVLVCNACIHWGKEEISVIFIFLNCSVHICMYFYYFLASFGPKVAKFLWWKPYITRIQMIQLVTILTLLIKLLFYDSCHVNEVFVAITSIVPIIFLYLFANFYASAYSKKKKH